jgi:hypothetical protein
LIVSVLLLLASGSAFAQAARTWVSGVGDDVNPCSRTAPCKTWAGAISKTAAGGIINCLDPGGFGAVTITKSITIACKPFEGSGLASSVNGVTINGAGIDVVLRGLDIDGGTPTSPGLNGIRFVQGASLVVDDCVIRDFKGATPNGNGIQIAHAAGTAKIFIVDSEITGNGAVSTGTGILIAPTGSGGATVVISKTNVSNNTIGLRVSTLATTGSVGITVTDTTVSGGRSHGIVAEASGAVRMMLDRVVSANNAGNGVQSTGSNALIRIGSSVVTGNPTGLATTSSGILQSYGNNQVNGNTVDGTPTAVALR